jgi:hypothetical protein
MSAYRNPKAAFEPEGRLGQLSARGLNRSRGRVPVARSAQLSRFGGGRKRHEIARVALPTLNSSLKTEAPS